MGAATEGGSGWLAGRYELEALIGRGGMGQVFRARDHSLDDVVAVKSIALEGVDAGATLRRFREEVRLARRVTHRNVARVFDLVEDGDGRAFLTMELIVGITLNELLGREGKLPLHRAARIGLDVAAGIEAIHAAGIVHRDLKPRNILLEESGRVVITDFGVAKNIRNPTSVGLGVVVGTPRYMAPEQAEGRAVDYKADVFAFALLLLEMMVGRSRPEERLEQVRREEIPLDLQPVLEACLASAAAMRPPLAEVSAVLERIVGRYEIADGEASGASMIVSGRAPGLAPEMGRLSEATRSNIERIGGHTLASSSQSPETSIVVLPFREVGPPTAGSLGEVVAQELTDVLAATSGLRVLATSATARFLGDCDRLRIGRELSVRAIIDGTLRIVAEQIQMSVRLIDAGSGSQLWTQSFAGSLGELFSFESTVVKRVAARLMARVQLIAFDGVVPAEAARCYLEARSQPRTPVGIGECLRLLARALELAPDLGPAVAAQATASMTAWFVPVYPTPPDWPETCERRVARALALAPDLAETHVAAGRLAWERGRLSEAASFFRHALSLAPTCGEALELLGDLCCRSGRTNAGLLYSRSAWKLDPSRFNALSTLAREEAFSGRLPEAMALLDSLGDLFAPPAFLLRMRAAAWSRDDAMIRAWLGRAWAVADSGGLLFGELVGRAFLGEAGAAEIDGLVEGLLGLGKSPMLTVDVLTLGVEIHSKRGRIVTALSFLESLAPIGAFVDVDWLERCPGIELVRESPAFQATLEITRQRARSISM